MQVVENQVLSKLEELLTREAIDEKVQSFKDNNYWYKQSYGTFIKRFEATRGKATMEAWVERTALIYSWLPRIPLQSFQLTQEELEETIKKLTELDSIFFEADLSTIGKTASSGQRFHRETIFPSYKGYYDIAIWEFLELGGRLLNYQFKLNFQLSSTTKLLHFMCPNLFPIFDTKICNHIFDSTYQTYDKYNKYVFGLQQYLEKGTEAAYIKRVAAELGFSPLYIIDLVIFYTENPTQ